MPEERGFAGKRLLMYVIGFVFNLSYALPTYVNSTFLAQLPNLNASLVGIIYTASSVLAILAFIEMSDFLRRWGNLQVTMGLLLLCMISLAGLATGMEALVIISSFILNFVSIALINFTLDVFLEGFSTDPKTGRIRGTFFTVTNAAWLAAPLITAALLGKADNYVSVYQVAGLLLIPVVFLVFFGLRQVKDPVYSKASFWHGFAEIWTNRDIKSILFVEFLLQFFYAWMIIYAPIYLHNDLGFSWATVSIIFTIMLIPFPVLGMPLGRLADWHGEKRIIIVGFIVMGVSTALIGFVTDHSAAIWAAILFLTRVGSASVEVMVDTYFFKHVNATNANVIGFARMIRPIAYVISPIIATILFTVFDIKGLFVFLGLLMLYGLRFAFALKDTRVVPEQIGAK